MAAQTATPLCRTISEATKPIRRMFVSRSSRENPSPFDRCVLNDVAVQQRHAAAAFEEKVGEKLGRRRLARARKTGEPDAEALFVPGRRRLPEDGRRLRAREPGRQDLPLGKVVVAHLGTGDRERPGPFRYAVSLLVPVLVRQVDHLPEGNHLHADLGLVPRQQLLRFVRFEEGLAVRTVAGPGVVPPDDEVVRAVVPPDDRVPERLARSGQAHCEGEKRQQGPRRVVVLLDERLVDADARDVVDVARLRQADGGVDQQRPVALGRRPLRQLLVAAVHRVSRLEGDDVRSAQRGEARAHFLGRQAQLVEVDVLRQTQNAERARHAAPPPTFHLADEGVRRVGFAEHARRFAVSVPFVDLADRQDGEDLVLRVAEGDLLGRATAGMSSGTVSVTGIGQRVPSARRISSRTRS